MRTIAHALYLSFAMFTAYGLAQAQSGVLWVNVRNLEDHPMPRIQVGIRGPGSVAITTNTGLARIALSPQTRPGSWVTLQVLNKNYALVSPYDGRIQVPLESNPENYVTVYLVTLSDRQALESGKFAVAMAAKFNAALKPSLKDEESTTADREAALAKIARDFGFTPEDVNRTITKYSKKATDPYDKGVLALYEKKYLEATEQLSISYEMREKQLAKAQTKMIDAAFFLGLSLYEQGKYAEAAGKFEVVNQLIADDAVSISWQGLSLESAGRYAEAEPLAKRALAISEKVLGPGHALTATMLNNLAHLYQSQGKYTEAEPVFKRALAVSEEMRGPEHPDTATVLNNLAHLYLSQGKYAEAEPVFKRALAIREKTLGPKHASTATTLNNLAYLYGNQGKYTEAELLYKRALAIYEKALGPEHALTANTLNNLALLYKVQGKQAEAEALYTRALAIREKTLGAEHPDTAITLNNLATLYRDQGKYAEAEPLYKRALAIREKTLGSGHSSTATVLKNYTTLLRRMNREDEAKALEARAKAIRTK